MADHAHHFLLLTVLGFGTLLIIFGMKYVSAGKQARLRLAQEGDYRGLVERATASQTANAASLANLQVDIAEMRARLASVETVLREVG